MLLDGVPAEILDVVVVRVNRRQASRQWDELRGDRRDSRRRNDEMARTNASFRQQLESLFCNRKFRQTTMVQYSYPRMAGSLYVVSTPIGNLDDITVRALNTLKSVGLVAAEDTRRTGTSVAPLRHRHADDQPSRTQRNRETAALLRKLADGVDIALVSDAGTPLVADPGQRLIAAAIAAGHPRRARFPGASAVLAALAASGYPADEFVFAGFAPSRSKDRKKWLARLARRAQSRRFLRGAAPNRQDAGGHGRNIG